MNRSLSWMFSVALLAGGFCNTAFAGEIDFIEDFSLATDRTVPLKQLIPGTEDFYYYHTLHFQNTEQFDKVDELLQAWIKRYNYTPRVNEIRYRQALLTYERNPQQSLEFIRQQLGIQFNHQRERIGEKPNLPLVLNEKLISRETLTAQAFGRYQNTQGFEDVALDWLAAGTLNPDQRRHLVQRLTRPDYLGLAKLVVDDLNHLNSPGFGAFPIHRQLLKSQLDECLKLKPELLNQANFVTTYLTKLHPSDDVDWRNDDAEHEAYLDRLWAFVQQLAPVHNSLKAHVLNHRLALDRTRGIHDKPRFMAYIALPRNVGYMNAKFLEREESRRFMADLNADFTANTLLGPVGNDEPLVRGYLHQFFVAETTHAPYEPFINDLYLKHNFAEVKIVNGLGEPEQWYSLLPPAAYQQLKERIDLDFASTNKKTFAIDEPVRLDLDVKNVATLIVKVFELNAKNFYRDNLREVDTDINLDGLVANSETTQQYPEPPLRRVRRHFEFPQLSKPGLYVIDFIGNGKSSRVLVRKGKLRYLVRSSVAGHVFTLLDGQNKKLSGGSVWLAGHEYKADKDGLIAVPYSNAPGRQPLILSHGDITSFDYFNHEAESYSLVTDFYVDRESLLQRQTAQLIVRPGLFLNGTPVTLSVLEEVRLSITSTDIDGVSSTKEVPNFKLFEDREAVHDFQVPQRLSRITFALRAKVQNLSQNKKLDLATQETYGVNEIDKTERVEDLYLANVGGTYVIDVLGKTGEVKPDRPVNLAFKHRDFRDVVNVTLQTNERGRIVLGQLKDIFSISATGPEGTQHTWPLTADAHTQYQTVHGVAGQPVEVPLMNVAGKLDRADISLLELRGDNFIANRFENVSLADGLLAIEKLPRGDYDLLIKRTGQRIRVRLAAGEARDGYVLSENRQLELRGQKPLQITQIAPAKDDVRIHLRNANPKFTRVHVFATRFQPSFWAFAHLSRVSDPEPYLLTMSKFPSLYVAGRNIGDEYRYIIDRKYQKKLPGNSLERPSLLLNPWAVRATQTGQQDAQAGDLFAQAGKEGATGFGRGEGKGIAAGQTVDFANLDFLPATSVVLLNLAPDEKGVVSIPRKTLAMHHHLHVVAIDPRSTVSRSHSLAEPEVGYRDLRLVDGLDPKNHYTQQKQISILRAGEKFELADITSSRFETYDSLAKVFSLFTTLHADPKLAEFSYVLTWPKLKPEEKRAKYSQYACHELHYFLLKKDPEFFRAAVLPYLANKKDKTFLDSWLVSQSLTDYLQPWSHEQLNIVERILLGQRIEGEAPHAARHVKDLFDLIPTNLDRYSHLFETALKSGALEAGDQLGLAAALKTAESATRAKAQNLVANGEAFGIPNNAPMAAGAMPAGKAGGAAGPGFAFGARPVDPNKPAEPGRELKQLSDKRKEVDKQERLMEERSAGEKEMLQRGTMRDGRFKKDAKGAAEADDALYFEADAGRRSLARQFYQKLDKTQEWAENNYYNLPIEQQNAGLVTVNALWKDFAGHDPRQPFFSPNLAEATKNFSEMMYALSVLDLPFEAGKHEAKFDGTKMTLTAASPLIVYHEEVKPAKAVAEQTPILVSQNFFRHGDRFRHVNNEQVDKYVADEFLVHTVYGCQLVITNPTSSRQRLEVLLQIPLGAMPVAGSRYTRSVPVDLAPYNTQKLEYFFYFPETGRFPHYPVHVAKNEEVIAFSAPVLLTVVDKLSRIDRESWDYISQFGTEQDVLDYLKQNNLHRTNLEKIAFRMHDPAFFQTVTGLLVSRHVYHNTLWSYSLKHNRPAAVNEYLKHADGFVNQCGSYLRSPLLVIDPVARKTYQHLDYRPLVNARAHQLGRRRQILNDRLNGQYHQLLKVLSYRRDLADDELVSVTYYLLLQDRIEEAQGFFKRVNADKLATRLQFDYFTAYLDFFTDKPQVAPAIVTKYANFPVDRWQHAFANVRSQLDEITGKEVQLVDKEDRGQQQTKLAATEPSFEFRVEGKKIQLDYQNLANVQINYYPMDIELLFSRNPFVQQYSGSFSYIRPNAAQTVALPEKQPALTIDLPEQFHNTNVLVEIIGAGETKSQAYYSNSLGLQVIENYGQLKVATTNPGHPIPKVYVKVYAQMQDGTVRFFKDGYTDLRGRFDYTSLNTNELDFVRKFSLLVLSDEHGAIVREAAPPKR